VGVDPGVAPVDYAGGHRAGRAQLARFVTQKLIAYADDRNHPDEDGGSGLSPWLHFGHIAADEVLQAILDHEDVSDPIARIDPKNAGEREKLLGLSIGAEAFLEQLLVWRELAYNTCAFTADCTRYQTLPA